MRLLITVLLVVILPFTIYSQSEQPKTGPTPNWVTINPVNFDNNKLDSEAEGGYVDFIFEKQISLPEHVIFYRKAIKILSEAGIQNSSKISIDFEPTYEQLTFHSIFLIRGKQKINKLDLKKIKTIQREKDLDRFMYDGSKTSVLFLEDVRNGDIIEYSYSIKGANPIFTGKYTDMLEAKFSVPVYQLYYKLIAEESINLTIRNSQTDIAPLITNNNNRRIYEWKVNDISALQVPDNIPSWHDPYPTVMISEYKTWKEVNDWAVKLFPFDVPLSAQLQKKIEDLKEKNKSQEDIILATLHFVQDEIRYLGIEIGESSHKPNAPEKTLNQRFGDCKDKSYLLSFFLRSMGIEANPVLINTSYKKTIINWLPSPTAFDHTVVRVKLKDSVYWFDPTISYQRGSINDVSFPDYQVGLIVGGKETGLTTIPFKKTNKVNIKEAFTASDMSGKASLIVTTNYTGSPADNTREEFKSNSLNEMQKTYLNYYASYFDKIKADSLSFIENKNGEFTTIEYYTVQDFWGESNSLKNASFEPYIINGIIKKIKDKNRSMPFSLPSPVSYNEEIEVILPDNWNVKKHSDDITCSNFILSLKYTCTGRKVSLKYHYENLKDHVLPEELKDYNASLAKANEEMGYMLTSNFVSEEGAIGNTTSNFTYLYILLALCVFVTVMIRKHKGNY